MHSIPILLTVSILGCLYAPSCRAYSDSLPSRDLLFAALDTFHTRKQEADLAEFDLTHQHNWMNYLPDISIGYVPVLSTSNNGISAKPRPAIAWSIKQIFSAKRNKEILAAKRRSIIKHAQLQYQKEQRKLRSLLTSYNQLKLELAELKRLFAIEEELFEYYVKSYENLTLMPAPFLIKKREYLHKRYQIQVAESELHNKGMSILEAAYWLGNW